MVLILFGISGKILSNKNESNRRDEEILRNETEY
jgi:hypothetical protein